MVRLANRLLTFGGIRSRNLGQISDSDQVVDGGSELEDPTHEKSHERAGAAQALGWLGDEEAVEGLVKALRDAEKFVRANTAESLGHLDAGTRSAHCLRRRRTRTTRYAGEPLKHWENLEERMPLAL